MFIWINNEDLQDLLRVRNWKSVKNKSFNLLLKGEVIFCIFTPFLNL